MFLGVGSTEDAAAGWSIAFPQETQKLPPPELPPDGPAHNSVVTCSASHREGFWESVDYKSGSRGLRHVISFLRGERNGRVFPALRGYLIMKEVKSERERGSRRRHRDEDVVAAAAVVVKQERLSPEAAPPAHRRPDSGGSASPPAGEPGRPGHRGNRAPRRSR